VTHYGSVSYRDTLSAPSIGGTEVLVNTRTGRYDMMRDARYQRFKVRIPSADNLWTFCAGVVPDLMPNGTL